MLRLLFPRETDLALKVSDDTAVFFRFGLVARCVENAQGEVGEEGAHVFAAVNRFHLRRRLYDDQQAQTVTGDIGHAVLDGGYRPKCGEFVHQQQALVGEEAGIVFRQSLLDVDVYQLAEKQIGQTAECIGLCRYDTYIDGHRLFAHIIQPEVVAGSGRFHYGIEKDAQRRGQ